jgi:hypothetical protein
MDLGDVGPDDLRGVFAAHASDAKRASGSLDEELMKAW